jgi:hypothetical protein
MSIALPSAYFQVGRMHQLDAKKLSLANANGASRVARLRWWQPHARGTISLGLVRKWCDFPRGNPMSW